MQKLDVTSDRDVAALGEGTYDSVVFLNVLEHIEDDLGALERINRLLRPGGTIVVLVPQYKWLFGSFDRQVGHHRRYIKSELRDRLHATGFQLVKEKSFNAPAIFGWWINAVLLQRKTMGKVQLKIFDMLVPVFSRMEKLLPLPGISLIAVAEKKSKSLQSP